MDKRYKQISLVEQIALREQAVEEVLANPQWSLAEAVSRVRAILRLTVTEMAQLAKVSSRTLQDVEAGRSEGTVSTLNSLLGVLGLRLGVQRVTGPGQPAPRVSSHGVFSRGRPEPKATAGRASLVELRKQAADGNWLQNKTPELKK
jgi:transcriptional regulator with XRE-family HTH domain